MCELQGDCEPVCDIFACVEKVTVYEQIQNKTWFRTCNMILMASLYGM